MAGKFKNIEWLDQFAELTLKELIPADKMLEMLENARHKYTLDDIISVLRWFFQLVLYNASRKKSFADRAAERTDILYRGKWIEFEILPMKLFQ